MQDTITRDMLATALQRLEAVRVNEAAAADNEQLKQRAAEVAEAALQAITVCHIQAFPPQRRVAVAYDPNPAETRSWSGRSVRGKKESGSCRCLERLVYERRPKMKSAASVLAWILLMGQNAPTYEETRAWVVSKITEQAGSMTPLPESGAYSTGSYQDVSMDGCKLRYSHVSYDSFLNETWVGKMVIPLGKDTSVSLGHWQWPVPGSDRKRDDYRVRFSTTTKVISMELIVKKSDGSLVRDDISALNAEEYALYKSFIISR
jgi:hypothetical protein